MRTRVAATRGASHCEPPPRRPDTSTRSTLRGSPRGRRIHLHVEIDASFRRRCRAPAFGAPRRGRGRRAPPGARSATGDAPRSRMCSAASRARVQPVGRARDRTRRARPRRAGTEARPSRCAVESCSSRAIAARSRSPASMTSCREPRMWARSDASPSSRMLNIEPTRSTSLSATRRALDPRAVVAVPHARRRRLRDRESGRSAAATSTRCTSTHRGEGR